MRVRYAAGKRNAERDARSTRFLLADHAGGYLALGAPNASNYDGYYVSKDARYKTLFDIAPKDRIECMTIGRGEAERMSASARQAFRLDARGIAMRGSGEFVVTLDCKRQFDEREEHRLYDVEIRPAHSERAGSDKLAKVTLVRISYRQQEYTIHAAIATTLDVSGVGTWREVRYPYDERRGTASTRWVYDALALAGDGALAFAVGADMRDAEQRALSLMLRPPSKRTDRMFGTLEQTFAWSALTSLRTHKGIVAGFPWFFDVWSRDELISLGAFLAAGEHEEVIATLDRWYGAITEDGEIHAIFPEAGLVSVDAPGWIAKRTLDALANVRDRQQLDRWRSGLERLCRCAARRQRDGLIWTGPDTTWMDTSARDDGRAGARVEIQALTTSLFAALAAVCECTGAKIPSDIQKTSAALAASIERLVDGDTLLDGLFPDGTQDRATRPNIFLAWYAAPSLFPDERWNAFFSHALDELTLGWGGLASLSPKDAAFVGKDSGEDVAAYHRGDSWYFLNSCAAMAITKTMPERAELASALLRAAIVDLFDEGYLGHCSEISSAASQEAMGCHAQAWSAALLFEALAQTRAIAMQPVK